MASQAISNYTAALNARASDLAAAEDQDAVRSIVGAAAADALSRSAIPDTLIYRITVGVLGLSVLAVIAAQLWITIAKGQAEIPQGMIAIGSAAIGALAGLLAPTPAS